LPPCSDDGDYQYGQCATTEEVGYPVETAAAHAKFVRRNKAKGGDKVRRNKAMGGDKVRRNGLLVAPR
jgi:hypothetical protein